MPGVIAIHPDVFEDKRDALGVAWNEALRLTMEDVKFVPKFEVTAGQIKFFKNTAYSSDELALRKTIVSRVATHDTSVSPTPEQEAETVRLLDLILEMPGISTGDRQVVTKMRESVAAGGARGETRPAPEAEETVEEPAAIETPAPGPEAPEAGVPGAGDAQSAALGGDVRTDPELIPRPQDVFSGAGVAAARTPAIVPDVVISAMATPVVSTGQAISKAEAIRRAVAGAIHAEKSEKVIGDRGRAIGPMQMWKIQVDQANKVAAERKLRVRFSYKDRYDAAKSQEMARIFFEDKYDRGTTDPVELGGRWRNPTPSKEKTPEWYLDKIREGIAIDAAARAATAGDTAAGLSEPAEKLRAAVKADVTVKK